MLVMDAVLQMRCQMMNSGKKLGTIILSQPCKQLGPFLPMLEKSCGVLLFISSIAGIEAFGAHTDYSTAKTAVIALAKNMARKLAKEVRVNVLAPGNVLFPGGSWDEKIKDDPSEVEKIIESTVPMNRFGMPEEIADAAVFLCSERAGFITGSVLVVDGGQTVRVF